MSNETKLLSSILLIRHWMAAYDIYDCFRVYKKTMALTHVYCLRQSSCRQRTCGHRSLGQRSKNVVVSSRFVEFNGGDVDSTWHQWRYVGSIACG